MSDADRYLAELDQIAGQKDRQKFKKLYGESREIGYRSLDNETHTMLGGNFKVEGNEELIRARARDLMERGIHGVEPYGKRKSGGGTSLSAAYNGALLYEKIGKGKKAIPKLLMAVKVNKGEMNPGYYEHIKAFIKRNTGERESSKGGLESKTAVFIGSILGGIALSIYSLTATGNAIGNLTGTTQGLLGLILFVVGIAGLVFSKR